MEATMNPFEATAVMVSLFIVRLAAPLVLTLLFGMMMNRIMQRGFYEN
jgi:hypothetical protein